MHLGSVIAAIVERMTAVLTTAARKSAPMQTFVLSGHPLCRRLRPRPRQAQRRITGRFLAAFGAQDDGPSGLDVIEAAANR